jgi:hypothetical protein
MTRSVRYNAGVETLELNHRWPSPDGKWPFYLQRGETTCVYAGDNRS